MADTPSLLVISGLDPSGGAGFIADVRVAELHHLRAVGVITALTEQDTHGVRSVHPVSADVLTDQLRAIVSDIEVAAVKIGMLGSEDITRAVADALAAVGAPVVWDPIVRPTAGSVRLYEGDPAQAARLLAAHLAVVTPNVPEAEALTGMRISDRADMRRAAVAIRELTGGAAALLKGGHLSGFEAVDVLAAGDVMELEGDVVALERPVHGTGCAFSTTLACQLAAGADMASACRTAKRFVARRLRTPERPGRGLPAVL